MAVTTSDRDERPDIENRVRSERHRIEETLALFRRPFSAMYSTSIARFDEVTESTEPIHPTDADVAAATIAIVMNQVIQDIAAKANVRGCAMLRAGPEFGAERFSRLLWATSGNARFFTEWRRLDHFDPEACYAVPMIALARTFGWSLPIVHLTSRTVLRRIGGPTYSGFEARVLETGLAIFRMGA